MAQTSAIRSAVPLRLGAVREAIVDRLERVLGKSTENATRRDIYDALAIAIREELTERWIATGKRVARARVKRICYMSMEFLLGRSLINALSSFEDELLNEVRETVESLGHDLDHIAAEEEDPGLGNGGLGRLAACFLDSLATLGYAATGYGIRYDYGIFTQVIENDGAQREVASSWLGFHNFWESGQGGVRHRVRFGGQCRATRDEQGRIRYEWVDTHDVWAVGYDLFIPGNRSPTVNHLRLWSGRAITPFRIEAFNHGNYAAAVAEQVDAKNLTRVLYPDDSTPQGKELRFKQQYFFVSASLQDLLGQHLAERRALKDLAERDCRAAQRHASGADHRRADALAGRQLRHGMGRWRGSSRGKCAATLTTRCCQKPWRPGRCRSSSDCCRGICRSCTRSIAISSKRSAPSFRRIWIAAAACR